ncbi:MAG: bifunctional folylpolyglutamate synthase/dihydrofolate synthase [Candidatus Cloacimonetes bacterium]|nr:bifunctional folylpolyglutamate synthase/dihydrofolate synthase [Candidatus Cloacimonadota bacterium]
MIFEKFLEQIYLRHSTNVKLGLDRIEKILLALGNPEKKLSGLHIAGTNGKGSVSAISESLLLSHDCTVGMNTSPHLIDYTERFRVNGRDISADVLMKLYDKNFELFENEEASFFEITTALAFKHFSDLEVDTAVIEVGLGGRLDGTNTFPPTVSVICTISLDHTKSLGDSIEKIAFEKAGIIKEKTPIVIGDIPKSAMQVIKERAKSQKAEYFIYGKDFMIDNLVVSLKGTKFDYSFPKYGIKLKNLHVNLLGKHQAHNTALALTAFIIYMKTTKKKVSKTKIRKALKQVNWKGRLEILSDKPLVLIDGAHNENGVSTLIENLKSIFPGYKYHFVISILKDKNFEYMIKEICSVAEIVYISKNTSERAAEVEEQANLVSLCDTMYHTSENIIEAVKTCQLDIFERGILKKKEKNMMIITGSLYTIAEVLKHKNELF